MKHRPPFSHQRPSWWPENEEWPPHRSPRHWRKLRPNPFFRRMGCLFGIFNLGGFVALIFGITYLLDYFGITHLSAASFAWLLIPFGSILIFMIVAAMIFATVRLRRMSVPLDELLEASNKVADGDYSARVEEKGWPEVRSLARTFNTMVEKLQAHDQQRRNMLADVTHELRTPITVMQGNLEGMIDGVYPADEGKLRSLFEETQILSRLVDDLRTLSLAEAGALELKREPTDLSVFVRDVVAVFGAQAESKNVKLDVSTEDVGLIDIDPQRVREVLSNLLSNALRYSPGGGVVKVNVIEAASSPERSVKVIVQDSGPGVEAADLGRMFDRFYKSSDSGGMGLGLSIAKYLVEAHGGKIWAESEPGRGTTISFAFPY